MDGRVVSVNVGGPHEIEWLGQRVRTSIWKSPVAGRLRVRGVNVDGDDQADRSVHGGPDKAVYSYALEDERWWAEELGRPVDLGGFGENLTTEGLDLAAAEIGERWEVGTVLLEVSQPRVPCYKLGARMGDPSFPPRFASAGRPGAYLRIVHEGELGAGDPIRVVDRPGHGLTVGAVAAIYHSERHRASELLDVPALAGSWRAWALKRVEAR